MQVTRKSSRILEKVGISLFAQNFHPPSFRNAVPLFIQSWRKGPISNDYDSSASHHLGPVYWASLQNRRCSYFLRHNLSSRLLSHKNLLESVTEYKSTTAPWAVNGTHSFRISFKTAMPLSLFSAAIETATIQKISETVFLNRNRAKWSSYSSNSRSRSRIFYSLRDTCTCVIPKTAAVSTWVFPLK